MSAERFRRERLSRSAAMDGSREGAEKATGGFMKIRNERLEGLLPQESVQRTVPTGGQGFEDMLARQLGQEAGGIGASTSPIAGLGGINPLLIAGQVETEASEDAELLSGLANQTDDLLGAWEQYAATLGSGQDSVKSAWSMLTGMDARIQDLRAEAGKTGTRGEGLNAVLNELEVLTATEKFKFNRGDYQ